MNVPTEQIRRTRQTADAEDLALLYMEEEVGRLDWANNWPKFKQRGDIMARVQEWLDDLNVQLDPSEIINCLDQLVEKRAGSWL